jgi:hypothetical protein
VYMYVWICRVCLFVFRHRTSSRCTKTNWQWHTMAKQTTTTTSVLFRSQTSHTHFTLFTPRRWCCSDHTHTNTLTHTHTVQVMRVWCVCVWVRERKMEIERERGRERYQE